MVRLIAAAIVAEIAIWADKCVDHALPGTQSDMYPAPVGGRHPSGRHQCARRQQQGKQRQQQRMAMDRHTCALGRWRARVKPAIRVTERNNMNKPK